MVYDKITNLINYIALNPLFIHVVNELNTKNFSILKTGKYDLENGIYYNLSEYKTKDEKDGFLECHKKFIDIQIMIDGEEQIGVCHLDSCIQESYDINSDLQKLSGSYYKLPLFKNYFMIFFPEDAHIPMLKINNSTHYVKKVVFKIPVNYS